MNQFFAELRRRNVFRVAAAYLVVGWMVMQIVSVVTPALQLPDWVDGFIVILLMAGLPITLLMAWAFEMTPAGVKKTETLDGEVEFRPLGGTDFVLIGLMVVVLGGIGFQMLNNGGPDSQNFDTITAMADSEFIPDTESAIADASIAVLAFEDLSPDGDQAYFSDGTSEEILNVLVRVEGLRVASRTSAFAYKGSPLRIPEIADELGVRHILEGSVRRSGDTIRITAQLIDAQTDEHLWSQTYDRTLTTRNVFAIQDEISQAIVIELSSRIAGLTPAAIPTATAGTSDIAILDLYYEANALFMARGIENLVRSTVLFEDITERDPEFARGWAGLAMVYTVSKSWGLPPRDYDSLTRVAAARALDINPELSSAYAVLANVEIDYSHPNWQAGMINFDTALRLNPNNANIYNWRALMWEAAGFSARAQGDLQTCLRLDPAYINCRYNLFSNLTLLGRHDEAAPINRQLMQQGATEHLSNAFYLRHLADTGDFDAVLLALNVTVTGRYPEDGWLVGALFLALTDPEYDMVTGFERVSQRLETREELRLSLSEMIALIFQEYSSSFIYEELSPEGHIWAPGMSRSQSRTLIEAARLPEFWRAFEYPRGCRAIPSPDGGTDDYDCDWMPAQ